MIYLRQSTASQEVVLPAFVDETDGFTAENGLSIANTDIKIWYSGTTTLANKNSGGATVISGGWYQMTLDATDTATLGSGGIFVHKSGARPVHLYFTVLPANIYDSMIAGTDLFDVSVAQLLGTAWATPATAGLTDVNVKQISTDATAADNAEAFFDGTGYAGTGNTIPTVTTLTNLPAITASWLTATGIAADAITAAKIADGAIDAATFAAGAINAAAIATDALGALELAADAVAEIADAVWDEARSGHTTAGTYGQIMSAVINGSITSTPTTVSFIDTTLTSAQTGNYIGRVIVFLDGALAGQATVINGFNTSTDKVTFEQVSAAPSVGDKYLIV